MFQMDDENIIIKDFYKFLVVKIKKNSLKILQDDIKDNSYYSKTFKLLKERIVKTSGSDIFNIYFYEKGKLSFKKEQSIDSNGIYDLCNVSTNEIAIYIYKEGKLYGNNAFLIFYDIEKYSKIKTLKLGDLEAGGSIKLVNQKTLLVDRYNKIAIVDVKNRIVKREIKINYDLKEMISINEDIFLTQSYYKIIQYEIDNYNVKEKERKSIESRSFIISKYPENKLIIINNKKATIFSNDLFDIF